MTSRAAAGPSPALSNVARFLALRGSPAALPQATWFAAALALAAVALPEAMLGDDGIDLRTSMLSCAVTMVFLCGVPWLLAWSGGHRDRYARGLVGLASADLVALLVGWRVLRFAEHGTFDLEEAWLPVLLGMGVALAWLLALRIRVWMFLTGQGVVRCGVLALMLLACEVWAQYALP